MVLNPDMELLVCMEEVIGQMIDRRSICIKDLCQLVHTKHAKLDQWIAHTQEAMGKEQA